MKKDKLETSMKGITLIALVVTIVVLLILAGVSIAMLTGENGIITQAKEAKDQTIISDEKESISIAYTGCMQDNMFEKNVTDIQLQTEMTNNGRNVTVIASGEDLIVTFNETTHQYKIDQEGKVEIIKTLTPEEAARIVDVITYYDDNIYVLTAGGEVKLANTIAGNIFDELEARDDEIITSNGVRKKGENWFIDNKGKVYTWGWNTDGQLGDGTTTNSSIPICISDIEGNALNGKNITDVYKGSYGYTVIAKDSNGKIYTWGYNRYGQLGNGTTTNSSVPICISDIENSELENRQVEKHLYYVYDGYAMIYYVTEEKTFIIAWILPRT